MKFTIEMIDKLTGLEFEHATADILFHNGYRDVKVTQASGDYGVDILARYHNKMYAIQCKRYEGSVGVKAVQEAASGADYSNCECAVVITNSNFTRQAVTLADRIGVRLIDRNGLIELLNDYDEEYDDFDPKNAAVINEYYYNSLNDSDKIYKEYNFEHQDFSQSHVYITSENLQKDLKKSSREKKIEEIRMKRLSEGMYVPNGTVKIGMGIYLINNEIYYEKDEAFSTTRREAKKLRNLYYILFLIFVIPIFMSVILGLSIKTIEIIFILLGILLLKMGHDLKKALDIQIIEAFKYRNKKSVNENDNLNSAPDMNVCESVQKIKADYEIESGSQYKINTGSTKFYGNYNYSDPKNYLSYKSKMNKRIMKIKEKENMYVPNGTVKAGMVIQLIDNEAYINGNLNKPITCNGIRRSGLMSIICGGYVIFLSIVICVYNIETGIIGIALGLLLVCFGARCKKIYNKQVKTLMDHKRKMSKSSDVV